MNGSIMNGPAMTATLLLGGRIHSPATPGATAMAVEDGKIAWVGGDDEGRTRFGAAAQQVRLSGALVTPAFVDSHVHATGAGLALRGLDLSDCRSLAECLAAVRAFAAADPGQPVWGDGWEETGWPEHRPPNRSEVDAVAGGAAVYLSRVDGHSALVSSALLEQAPGARGAAGWSETGPLSQDAHHHVRLAAQRSIGEEQRDSARRAFLRHAASHGIAAVHECAGPVVSSEQDLECLLALGALTGMPDVVGYWGELGGADTAIRLGARGAAGDLFVDGALGSRTAALRCAYADDPGNTGVRYLDAGQIAEHVVACTEAGVQAGFHVIGDAAVAEAVAGYEAAADKLGTRAVAAAGHRLEHLEMVDAGQARRLAALGVSASVQPMFDALWGGADRMYAGRLGPGRGNSLNPFATLRDAGVSLAFSSDAPVTGIGPWAAVRAAIRHRTPGQELAAEDAFAAHTTGGWRAAGSTDPAAGTLVPGAPATYAIWDATSFAEACEQPPRCLRTVLRGETIHERTT